MVIKSFITYILNRYLKNYIQRLDYEKIKVGIKHGNLYLENLEIKADALAYLNLPATVAFGFIEKLRITIPWNKFSSSSSEIVVQGIYLLIVPKNEMSQDLSEHHQDKMRRVQSKLERLRRAALDEEQIENKDNLLIDKLKSEILRNLTIEVHDFHLSYEMMSPSKVGHPFSFGLTFHYLKLSSRPNSTINDEQNKSTGIFKISELRRLSIYWTSLSQSRIKQDFHQILNQLKSNISRNCDFQSMPKLNYIVYPVDLRLESKFILKRKQHHYQRSTIDIKLSIEQLTFHVDPQQLSDILDFCKHQNYTSLYDRCREYRSILDKSEDELTEHDRQRLEILERKLDVFHLAFNKHRVEIEKQIKQSISTDQSILTNNEDKLNHRLSSWNKFKKTFHKQKSDKSHRNQRKSFDDNNKISINIELRLIKIHFYPLNFDIRNSLEKNDDKTLLFFCLDQTRLEFEQKSISSNLKSSIEINSMNIYGIEEENDRSRPIIFYHNSSSNSSFIQIELDLYSPDDNCSYRFYFKFDDFKINYHRLTIDKVLEQIQLNSEIHWNKLTKFSLNQQEIENDLALSPSFYLRIESKTLSLMINQSTTKPNSLLELYLGSIQVENLGRSNNENINLIDKLYNEYSVDLSDLKLIYQHSNQHKIEILRQIPSISCRLKHCFYSNHPTVFSCRLCLLIPRFEVQLSSKLIENLLDHINRFPNLFSNISTIIKRINFYFSCFPPETTIQFQLEIYNLFFNILSMKNLSKIRTDVNVKVDRNRHQDYFQTNLKMKFNQIEFFRGIKYSKLINEINQIELFSNDIQL